MSALVAMSVGADEAMTRGFLDAHNGDVAKASVDWQKLRAEADAELEREIGAARGWTPLAKLAPLTPEERAELERLLTSRLAQKPTVGAVQRRREDAGRGRPYALAALEGEAEAVASAREGLRNHTLNASAWTLARPELDGLLGLDGSNVPSFQPLKMQDSKSGKHAQPSAGRSGEGTADELGTSDASRLEVVTPQRDPCGVGRPGSADRSHGTPDVPC